MSYDRQARSVDDETWQALDMLARDRMMNFQELADEAFADLLRKHDRPTDLKDALKRSVKERSNSRKDKPARRAPRGRHD
jgi:non-homologous end joining protein Ku